MVSSAALKVGGAVRRMRQRQGWSQLAFSLRCGFHQTYLSRIENGTANPSLLTLEVLANALGCSVFELMLSAALYEKTTVFMND